MKAKARQGASSSEVCVDYDALIVCPGELLNSCVHRICHGLEFTLMAMHDAPFDHGPHPIRQYRETSEPRGHVAWNANHGVCPQSNRRRDVRKAWAGPQQCANAPHKTQEQLEGERDRRNGKSAFGLLSRINRHTCEIGGPLEAGGNEWNVGIDLSL